MILLPTMRGIIRPRALTGAATAEIWIDPSDLSSMRQEASTSATTPAAIDSPVGYILNKGTLGGVLVATSTSSRPYLRTGSNNIYLEATSATSVNFTTAHDDVFTNNNFVLTYGCLVQSSGTILGGTGTNANQNLHTGIAAGQSLTFAYFGNNLGYTNSTNLNRLVASMSQTNSGRILRKNAVQVASDFSTAKLTNGSLKLFQGPLGSGGGTNRLYGLIARRGLVADAVRNSDEMVIAALTGITIQPEVMPLMTADTAPSGHSITTSGAMQQPAWNAFNGAWATSTNDLVSSSSPTMPWSLTCTLPTPTTCSSYRLIQHTDSGNSNWNGLGGPTDWTISGSNDGTNWTVIDTRANQPNSIGTQTTYTVASPGLYSRYRMTITKAGNGGTSPTYIIFGELTYYL